MSPSDISQILEEAKNRWLRPSEVCEIIRNYQRFHLKPDPPYKPSGGSLFLFDRKTLRYFRKDGHRWRKKKDGKTVREAHEKLKSGSVDVLHCYYAHGEENENFQRRSYWMLDGQLEHIVLVHYREVNEGGKPEIPDLFSPDSGFPTHQSWSHHMAGQPSYGSSPSTVAWSEQAPSSELDDVDSWKGFRASPLVEPVTGLDNMTQIVEDLAFASDSHPYEWGQDIGRWDSVSMDDCDIDHHLPLQETVCHASTSLYADDAEQASNWVFQTLPGRCPQGFAEEEDQGPPFTEKESSGYAGGLPCEDHAGEGEGEELSTRGDDQQGGLKRHDSFWRWLSNEMGEVCDVSLMANGSGNCWNSMEAHKDDTEISSLSRELHLDLGSPGPSLSQDQLFSILDFSPDWAYSAGSETKVLIAGSFLGEAQYTDVRWSCMFGEVEVPAEALSRSALRCCAPLLPPGRVPFYVTCSNRLGCSEIREFEYRDGGRGDPSCSLSGRGDYDRDEQVNLQMRLARIVLCGGAEDRLIRCPASDECPVCAAFQGFFSALNDGFQGFCVDDDPMDILVQRLLGSRLCEWLLMKAHEDGKGPNVLDDEGQGVVHLAAALGYGWAMKPIIAAGVSPNFRDARGWTPLHWAAYFGREETAVTLVSLGSSPGAVADPTADNPHGRTAADLASWRGHKGISGYLAESDLTCQLSSLDLEGEESVMDCVSASVVAEAATQGILGQDRGGHLRETLAVVRASSQAAARIRSALRARPTFQQATPQQQQQQQQAHRYGRGGDVTDEDVACLSSGLFRGRGSDALHVSAAVRIQHKYRGWSGRREFLKMRDRVVKIQAHVRGHQVRRQYKKFVWSVGIVEKAILRWRRRGCGLRGFRGSSAADADDGRENEYDFLQVGRQQKAQGVERALARVQSMARRPEARVQYLRMVASRTRSKSTPLTRRS